MNVKYLHIFILVFIACEHKPRPQNKAKSVGVDAGKFVQFPYIAKENSIQKLVGLIDSGDCVYFGRIGYNGEESEIYDCYQRLLEIASDSIWIKLTNDKNPVLRVYAFRALESKKSSRLQEVKDRLLKDKATVCYVSADTRIIVSVSSFVSTSK